MSENKHVPKERREFLEKAGKFGLAGAAISLLMATRDRPAMAVDGYGMTQIDPPS